MPKKQKTWRSIWPVVVLLILYFATRLFYLTLLPLYTDEAHHVIWAIDIVERGDFSGALAASRLFPVWVISLVVPLATHDLLLGARLVSVEFGVLGLFGCYWLGHHLFDRRVGILAAILYLVVPYTFFHDRMALVDGLLTVWAIYVVLLSLMLSREPNLKYSLSLGVVLALSSITKINGFIFFIFPLIILAIARGWSLRQWPWKSFALAYGVGLLGFVLLLADSSTEWWQIGNRMWMEQAGPNTSLWLTWLENGKDTLLYLGFYLSWPVFVVVCLGLGLAVGRHQRDELLLLGIAGVILGMFIFFSRIDKLDSRYLLPAVPFLLVVAARTIIGIMDKIRWQGRQWFSYVITLAIILPALWFDYWLVTNPSQTPFVKADLKRYVEGKYAGYGLVETSDYLRKQLSSSPQIIVVYSEKANHTPNILKVYLYDQRQRVIHLDVDFLREDPSWVAQRLLTATAPVFIITPDPTPGPTESKINFDTWPYIQRVAHFERPGGSTGVNIYTKKP